MNLLVQGRRHAYIRNGGQWESNMKKLLLGAVTVLIAASPALAHKMGPS
jgi:hypothetical protein